MLQRAEFFGRYEEMLLAKELSYNEYSMPVKIDDLLGIYKPMYSPEHKGEFVTAVDFAVEDPRIKETEVLAPCNGVVVAGRLDGSRWGITKEDGAFLNWVHVRTTENEFYELAHIEPIQRRILRVGDVIKQGEVIAIAGLNGRMTTTSGRVDSHIHMFVGKYGDKGFSGLIDKDFHGLRIKWSEYEVK